MILCIGASGQLARSLALSGEDRVLVRGRTEIDLRDPVALAAKLDEIRPACVINAAAYTAVDAAETDFDEARSVNRTGAMALARMCGAMGTPMIHISTDYVFDGTKGAPYVETDPPYPLNAYGLTKLEGEAGVMRVNPDAVIVRTSWVHSPYAANFTKTMMHLLLTRDDVRVVMDQQGSPTYAPHLAEALITLATKLKTGQAAGTGGVYHLAGAGFASRYEWVEEIARCLTDTGRPTAQLEPANSEAFQTPAKRPADTRLDCAKMEAVFGLALPAWQEGVRACVLRLLGEDGDGE